MASGIALPAPLGAANGKDDTALAEATLRRVSLRLLPFLFLLYICNFLDRTNVGIAALQMNLAPFWCLPTKLLRGSAAAAGIALVNAIGNTGGFVGPYVVGRIKDATGSTSGAFLALALIALAAAGLCLMLARQAAFVPPGRRRVALEPTSTAA